MRPCVLQALVGAITVYFSVALTRILFETVVFSDVESDTPPASAASIPVNSKKCIG